MRQEELMLAWIMVAIFAVLLIVAIVLFIIDFSCDANYIKSEINRTAGREKRYWQRELRAFYLSLIPGISLERAKKIAHRKHIKR